VRAADQEVSVVHYEVTITDVPARTVVAKRLEVAADRIGPAIQRTLAECYAWVARSGIEPVGEPFVIYHRRPTVDSGWHIEVCAPVSAPMQAPTGCVVKEIPATSVATTIHVGPYTELGAAYSEVEGFIRTHQLDVAGPPREIYLSEPDVPSRETRTRIEFPVKRVPVAVGTGTS
jgi:effector-binding domain-containing protein